MPFTQIAPAPAGDEVQKVAGEWSKESNRQLLVGDARIDQILNDLTSLSSELKAFIAEINSRADPITPDRFKELQENLRKIYDRAILANKIVLEAQNLQRFYREQNVELRSLITRVDGKFTPTQCPLLVYCECFTD